LLRAGPGGGTVVGLLGRRRYRRRRVVASLWRLPLVVGGLVLVIVVPLFFALAGSPVETGRDTRGPDEGMTVDFAAATCGRLPDPERHLCDYGALFNAAGEQSRIDPRLLAAVAYAESGYAADVVECRRASPDGAQGLMQFMPGTADERGVDPCNPSSAIFGAAGYLRELHEELRSVAAAAGDTSERHRWELAVAGYNAGPNGVVAARGVPRNGETELYVPRVMAKWEEYQGLFPATGGVGGCPTATPSGSTDRIETEEDHITRATQRMANAVIECFGRGGRPIYCYDPRDGSYEHPRGRACDFMIAAGIAEGDERARGQDMAEWLVDNADELNVLYVIWYRRIWDHSMGDVPWEQWRPYSGPSPHTDHVHASIRLQPGDASWAACPHDRCSGPAFGVPR
jgi:transglycosylase-like protein with SLT domain